MKSPRQRSGAQGEDHAVHFLRARGYSILARNWRVPSGEIDIIARSGSYIVFVEVKSRRSTDFADAVSGITIAKRRRVISAALAYIQRNFIAGSEYRFDTIAIDGTTIEHQTDAFCVDEFYSV